MTIDLSELGKEAGPLLVFCLGIFFATLGIRRAVESFYPKVLNWAPWKKLFVRSMPPAIGAIAAAFMHKYPFLSVLPTWGTRAMYGAVAGGLSSYAYAVVKAVVQAKYGVKINDGTTDPPPPADDEPPTDPNPERKP
jgi:hypothetical protein